MTMKTCPTCQTKYDEEVIRFCIKDGTPLVEEGKPEFKEMPSETPEDDDVGEQTIIRRNKPSTPLPPPVDSGTEKLESEAVEGNPGDESSPPRKENDSKRIVISTDEPAEQDQGVRAKAVATSSSGGNQSGKKSNAALVAFLSIFGTLVVLAGIVGIYWFLSSQGSTIDANANTNLNANADENLDSNFNADDLLDNLNLNTNSNENTNVNINANANTETPTPTPTKTPTPTPSPSPSPTANANTNANAGTNVSNQNTTPTPVKTPVFQPTPRVTPTPTKTPATNTNTNRPVNVGQINGRAVRLPTPNYSAAARQARASGRVTVRVLVDENGNVLSASALSGHPLLRRSAEQAARRSKFRPVTRNGQRVKSTGTIAYNFVN